MADYEFVYGSGEVSSHPTDEPGLFVVAKSLGGAKIEHSYFEIGQFIESDYRAIAGNRFIYNRPCYNT